MPRDFKLKEGTIEQRLKQLELIINRMLRKINPQKTVILPPTVIHFGLAEVSNLSIRTILFRGTLKKIAYKIGSAKLDGKDVDIDLQCMIQGDSISQVIPIKSKRKAQVIPIDTKVADGSLAIITSNIPDVIHKDIMISLMLVPDYQDKQMILIGDSDEGI